tara:strand:+ start:3577 stop:4377 length:801 start_codon:yes stop_codon:yes gene_type:complete
MNDPYSVLGVERGASLDDVKKAYRKLTLKHHPDRGGDEAKFKEINDAYENIKNPKAKGQPGWSYSTNTEDIFSDFMNGSGFADVFNQVYGRSATAKSRNVNTNVSLTLEEAYHGSKRRIRIGMKTIDIKIPKGVKHKQKLKIKGYGQVGETEEKSGDLIITLDILESKDFYRDDKGIHTIINIELYDAILGHTDTIDVYGNKYTFSIPPGTQNGGVLRLKGKGFPLYRNPEEKDDLYLTVNIKLPEKLTDREIKLFEQLRFLRYGR